MLVVRLGTIFFVQSEEKEGIFRILAAVLHLGNMFFGSADVRMTSLNKL